MGKRKLQNTLIRPIEKSEYPLLDDFSYEAIFIPEGMEPPSREIIYRPELQVYVDGFGTKKDDHCLVAEVSGTVVGAVWVRVMDDYGHVANDVPSFAISLRKEYRGAGIGTKLMKQMLALLNEKGYERASLAVQKENYAFQMYRNVGFRVIGETEEEYLMMYHF